MSEPIKASYLETADYYLEAHDNGLDRTNPIFPSLLVVFVGCLFGLSTIDSYQKGERSWWFSTLVGVGTIGYVLFIFLPSGRRWRLARRLKKELSNPPIQASFEFGDEGFISLGRGGETRFHPWGNISKAVECDGGVAIYFQKNTFYWVSRSAFAEARLYEELLKQLRSKLRDFRKVNR